MKRFASSIIGFAASAAFLLAATFDARLTYSAERYGSDPASVEAKVRDNHTDDEAGSFNEPAYTANMIELQKFYGMTR